ncbi:hypothetical protein [Cellulomonas phragmiteti]|uniref:Lipoprotein LpqB beta-propeller domain-containing protein n=1 Tax=Cellulomonas phragmiteti TaxID=478780 RepID=A0ABQ4DNH8_9CELL|nr:hypothetical protein [Cellulomonas phragmiteti]GIG40905.1 hypothetical protein Cph01nite_26670 [Cellulomonas phragmiteti]
MTDLGHLLSSVEQNVEQAHTGAATPAEVLAGTRATVRRRRLLRHVRDGATGALAVVAVAGLTTWGLQARPTPPADVVPTPSTGPTPTATTGPDVPESVALTLGAPVQVATPRDVPVADLLAAAGPGWSLVTVTQERVGASQDVMQPGDLRSVIALMSPTGERTTLLDVAGTTSLGIVDWRAGAPVAQASGSVDVDAGFVSGTLDLRTGQLTPVPFPWVHHALGTAATGESVWLVAEMPADLAALDDEARSHLRPAAPGSMVALDPESVVEPGGDPTTVPHLAGRLWLVAPDGALRDLGDVSLPHRLPPMSPDGRWLALQAPDGGLQGVDLRAGTTRPVAGAPTDPACRLAGWAGAHAVLSTCPGADGAWQLDAVDLADGGATRLATSDVPVRDAWPLGDGRVGLGRVVLPAPCDVVSDPAVLQDGAVRSLTDAWSPYDHGTWLTFTGGAAWTSLNGCYPGTGRADPQRDVRVDLTTGETSTLAWLEPRRGVEQVVEDDVWRVTGLSVVPGR